MMSCSDVTAAMTLPRPAMRPFVPFRDCSSRNMCRMVVCIWSTSKEGSRYIIFTSMTTVGSRSSGKYKIFCNYQNTMLSSAYQSNISIKSQQDFFQKLDGDCSKCAMKIALVAWVGHRGGMQCSLAPLFQSLYCTELDKQFNDLLSTLY